MTHSKIALISDIHANAAALRAVLKDIYAAPTPRADEIWCLGDLLGYGSDPVAVVHLALGLEKEEWPAFHRLLGGNHDGFFSGYWSDLHYFNEQGKFALLVHEGLLQTNKGWPANYTGNTTDIYTWVRHTFKSDSFALVDQPLGNIRLLAKHSMPDENPARAFRYVYPWSFDYLNELFAWVQNSSTPEYQHTCYFLGHTHIPLFCRREDDHLIYLDVKFNQPQPLPDGISVINPGSVGQPRGYNNNHPFLPTYVILDPQAKTVEFRRVEYDQSSATAALYSLASASEQFPGVAQNLNVNGNDWSSHANMMVEKLLTVFANLSPPRNWEKMEGIYQFHDWGWQGTKINIGQFGD